STRAKGRPTNYGLCGQRRHTSCRGVFPLSPTAQSSPYVAKRALAPLFLGGLAPDAVTTDKEASHFYRGKHKEYTRRIAYEEFYDKYSDHPQQDYILGYYCHLIADDLWLTGFFSPWLKNRIETHEEIL